MNTAKPCSCLAAAECERHGALDQVVMVLAACQGALGGFARTMRPEMNETAAFCDELSRAADKALRRIGST